MPSNFSFFTRSLFSTWQNRGVQVCEYLGGKLNPTEGYEDDVCIYVKLFPENKIEPKYSYYDLVDPRDTLTELVRKETQGGIIAISKTQTKRFERVFQDRDIVFIPEHHCNFDRESRHERPVTTVGCIGSPYSIQYSQERLARMLSDIGLKWEFRNTPKTRRTVVRFYRRIDIQICFRTSWNPKKGRMEDKNPLKPANAGSFGIPTVAYPEVAYVAEWPNECLYGNTMEEVVAQVKRLKDDPGLYQEMSERVKAKAEEYHIEHISKKYLELLERESPMRFRFTGKLLDKEVKINGESKQVYGLASLSVRPRQEGFGSELIKSFDKLAENKGKWGVVAFTDERTWPFYAKTGWYRHGIFKSSNYPDRIIVTSKPCENIEVTERW